jgi:EAL domain-containing protein (putative c-di-GMP-specific phosphodiesterase class I)
VNVSPLQLRQPQFVPDLLESVAACGGTPHWLNLEITESMLMNSFAESVGKLGALRTAGIEISLDDFGTGYSSLSYLAQLPLSALKIDRSFVARMASSPYDTAIVSTIVSLGRNLNLKVVAEGVETEEQAKLLRLLHCSEGQGYLFGRPLSPPDAELLLPRGTTGPA